MLNYTQTPARSTAVPGVLPTEQQSELLSASPLSAGNLGRDPMPTGKQERSLLYSQGYQKGQSEAEALLAQAAQAKGTPLTKREISSLCNARLQILTDEWRNGPSMSGWPVIEDWESGWSVGFTWACILAERQAPDPDGFRRGPLLRERKSHSAGWQGQERRLTRC